MFLANFTIALAAYYVIWLSLVSDYGIFWGVRRLLSFFFAVVMVIALSQAWANLSLFFLCQVLRSFTKVSRFMFFPCSVQVIVYFY